MTEKQKYQDYPKNFEVKHDNGETIICHSSSENCQILTEVMPGYSPEEKKLIIDTSIATLQAVDKYCQGLSADIFSGLHVVIGEDLAGGGGEAIVEENRIVLNGRKMLISLNDMRRVSGSYSENELVDFPDPDSPASALQYTLVHEVGHILDWYTESGQPYHRIPAEESPTSYGRTTDQWHTDSKDHEAFAEGFAHAVYGVPISEAMAGVVKRTVEARAREVAEKRLGGVES